MRYERAHVGFVCLRLVSPLVLCLAFLGAMYIRFYSGWVVVGDLPDWPSYSTYFVVSLAVWSVLETRFRLLQTCAESQWFRGWVISLIELNLLTLALVSSAAFFWRGYSFSRFTVALFWTLHVLSVTVAGWVVRAWVRGGAHGSLVRVFAVGDSFPPAAIERECLAGPHEVRVERFPDVSGLRHALERFETPPHCREIVVAVPAGAAGELAAIAEVLARQPVRSSIAVHGLPGGEVYSTPTFTVFSGDLPAVSAFDYVLVKRVTDVILAGFGLAIFAPAMLIIAAVTRFRSGGPVLLAQERVGRGGRRFPLYKFRSLPVSALAGSDSCWTASPAEGWGSFLRRTGLDELPQLWNVLRGDMSLVGPRPERPYFVEQFRRQLPLYATRHRLQAGITGWAQVNGWRGDTSIPQRVEHDLYYLHHWSLRFDLLILWMTLGNFLRHLWGTAASAEEAPHARSV